jgi:4-hydroxy-tetrahydrodipicolinate synthase
MQLTGVWLPIITPFKNDKIDFKSYKRLIEHYSDKGISGFIPLGTTGEIPTLSEYEFEEMIERTMDYNKKRLPVYIGIGGNYTAQVIKKVKIAEYYDIQGILSVCPYYNKPSQEGIYAHFKAIAEETALKMIVYNIPYRTGVNIENDTIRRMAEIPNIIGLKDCCGDIKQSMSLLLDPPKNFSILSGEDLLFYLTLTLGGHGGILASSHIRTEDFVEVYQRVKNNDTEGALQCWKSLYDLIPLLFKEPNPTPIKYYLSQVGLIDSDEVRLPLTPATEHLKQLLDRHIPKSAQTTSGTLCETLLRSTKAS